MRRIFGLVALAITLGTTAQAGKNAGGALLVHTDDSVTYTSTADYCASTLPTTCADLVTQTNKEPEAQSALVWFLAVFDAAAEPTVTAIQFGIETNLPPGQDYVAAWSACGSSSLELPDEGFPDAGRGDLIAYWPPESGHLWPFYWFAVIAVDESSYFGTGVYPSTGEAKFVDDSDPSFEDLVVRFGTVRWGTLGENACPVPPGRGACCTSWGSCVEGVDASTCEDLNGFYQGTYAGDNTTCSESACGACCYALGSDENEHFCANTTELVCYDRFGDEGSNGQYTRPYWAGEGTRCTFSADSADTYVYCNPFWGSCCLPDGSCQVRTLLECNRLSGTFHGNETCEPNECVQPPMACCFSNGHCEFVTAEYCQALGGAPQGIGTDCEPNPCPPPSAGACCLDDQGNCRMLTQAECAEQGGQYQGDDEPCDPNPCPVVPTRNSTWGRIKAGYR